MKFHSRKWNKNNLRWFFFIWKSRSKTKVDKNITITCSSVFILRYFYRKTPDETMKFSPNLRCWFLIPVILREQSARLDGIVFDHVKPWRQFTKKRLRREEVALKGGEQAKAMKPSRVLRLALLVACLESVWGTPVDQKEKLFALVSIKFKIFMLVSF